MAAFLAASLLYGSIVNAQTTGDNAAGNNMTSDSTHRGMHHHWGPRNGGDSLAKKEDFHRQGGFGPRRDGWQDEHRDGGPRDFAHRDGFGPRDRFEHRGGFGEGIHYTPDQRKQVAAINADYKKAAADLFKNDNLTLRQYKAQLVALNKDKKAKTQALLTQQQKDQLAARKQRATENFQVAQAAHLERLKLRLNLSDDQIAKLKANQDNFHTQLRTLHENDDLLPQQKMEQMKDLVAKNKDSYKSILTPEQYTKFQEMSRHRGFGHDGHDGSDGPGRHFGPGGAPGADDDQHGPDMDRQPLVGDDSK